MWDGIIWIGILLIVVGVGSRLIRGDSACQDHTVEVLCVLVGGCMAGLPLLFRFIIWCDMRIVGVPFTLAGGALLVFEYMQTFYKKSRCTLEVEAEVTMIHSGSMRMDGRSHRTRRYSFAFVYGGQKYGVTDLIYAGINLEKRLEVGEKIMIKIDPANPEEFYRSRPGVHILGYILGLSTLFASSLPWIFYS